jgi:predicted Zn-dependent peptidase
MTRRSLPFFLFPLVALALVGASSPVSAEESPPSLGVEGLTVDVVRHQLANGLTLLMVERHAAPVVSTYVRFKVGSAHEYQGVIGAAHLVEHMLYKGTTTIGTQDYQREIELMAAQDRVFEEMRQLKWEADRARLRGDEIGGSLIGRIAGLEAELDRLNAAQGQLIESEPIDRLYTRSGAVEFNASTGYDGTRYYLSLPSNRLELWARVTADQIENPVFREFYAERDVVTEERRLSVDNQPDMKLYEQVIGTAYLAHPYQIMWEWIPEVENITRAELSEFYRRYYAPNRAVICLVGDLDPVSTLALVERYFGRIPAQPDPEPIVIREPEQRGERRLVVQFDAEPQVLIAWHKVASGHPDDAVFAVIGEVLARGRTSRFYSNLVEGKQVAQAVSVEQYPGDGLLGSVDPGLFMVHAQPRSPHTAAELEAAVLAEVARLAQEPVAADELERVKTNIEADFIRRLRSNLGLASQLADYEGVSGDWGELMRAPARVRAVTAADVMRVAGSYLGSRNRTVGWLERPSDPRPEVSR